MAWAGVSSRPDARVGDGVGWCASPPPPALPSPSSPCGSALALLHPPAHRLLDHAHTPPCLRHPSHCRLALGIAPEPLPCFTHTSAPPAAAMEPDAPPSGSPAATSPAVPSAATVPTAMSGTLRNSTSRSRNRSISRTTRPHRPTSSGSASSTQHSHHTSSNTTASTSVTADLAHFLRTTAPPSSAQSAQDDPAPLAFLRNEPVPPTRRRFLSRARDAVAQGMRRSSTPTLVSSSLLARSGTNSGSGGPDASSTATRSASAHGEEDTDLEREVLAELTDGGSTDTRSLAGPTYPRSFSGSKQESRTNGESRSLFDVPLSSSESASNSGSDSRSLRSVLSPRTTKLPSLPLLRPALPTSAPALFGRASHDGRDSDSASLTGYEPMAPAAAMGEPKTQAEIDFEAELSNSHTTKVLQLSGSSYYTVAPSAEDQRSEGQVGAGATGGHLSGGGAGGGFARRPKQSTGSHAPHGIVHSLGLNNLTHGLRRHATPSPSGQPLIPPDRQPVSSSDSPNLNPGHIPFPSGGGQVPHPQIGRSNSPMGFGGKTWKPASRTASGASSSLSSPRRPGRKSFSSTRERSRRDRDRELASVPSVSSMASGPSPSLPPIPLGLHDEARKEDWLGLGPPSMPKSNVFSPSTSTPHGSGHGSGMVLSQSWTDGLQLPSASPVARANAPASGVCSTVSSATGSTQKSLASPVLLPGHFTGQFLSAGATPSPRLTNKVEPNQSTEEIKEVLKRADLTPYGDLSSSSSSSDLWTGLEATRAALILATRTHQVRLTTLESLLWRALSQLDPAPGSMIPADPALPFDVRKALRFVAPALPRDGMEGLLAQVWDQLEPASQWDEVNMSEALENKGGVSISGFSTGDGRTSVGTTDARCSLGSPAYANSLLPSSAVPRSSASTPPNGMGLPIGANARAPPASPTCTGMKGKAPASARSSTPALRDAHAEAETTSAPSTPARSSNKLSAALPPLGFQPLFENEMPSPGLGLVSLHPNGGGSGAPLQPATPSTGTVSLHTANSHVSHSSRPGSTRTSLSNRTSASIAHTRPESQFSTASPSLGSIPLHSIFSPGLDPIPATPQCPTPSPTKVTLTAPTPNPPTATAKASQAISERDAALFAKFAQTALR